MRTSMTGKRFSEAARRRPINRVHAKFTGTFSRTSPLGSDCDLAMASVGDVCRKLLSSNRRILLVSCVSIAKTNYFQGYYNRYAC